MGRRKLCKRKDAAALPSGSPRGEAGKGPAGEGASASSPPRPLGAEPSPSRGGLFSAALVWPPETKWPTHLSRVFRSHRLPPSRTTPSAQARRPRSPAPTRSAAACAGAAPQTRPRPRRAPPAGTEGDLPSRPRVFWSATASRSLTRPIASLPPLPGGGAGPVAIPGREPQEYDGRWRRAAAKRRRQQRRRPGTRQRGWTRPRAGRWLCGPCCPRPIPPSR